MTKFFFVPYVLRLLSQGTFFRKLFFYLLRASAVITALVGLVVCAGLLKTVLNLPAVGVIGGFVFIALALVAFYSAAHIYWIRAGDIDQLSDAKFTMIPISAIMVRTLGEVLAAFIAVMSIGGFILFLFAPQEAGGMLAPMLPMGALSAMDRGGNSFVEALVVLVAGTMYAVLLLACFYLASEFISALAQIAINTGITAANTSRMAGAPAPSPVAPAPLFTTPSPALGSGLCRLRYSQPNWSRLLRQLRKALVTVQHQTDIERDIPRKGIHANEILQSMWIGDCRRKTFLQSMRSACGAARAGAGRARAPAGQHCRTYIAA